MSPDTAIAIGLSIAGAFIGLLVAARELHPRHLATAVPAVIGEGWAWCPECTGRRWSDLHKGGSHTCATCRTHTTEDAR